MGNTFNKFVGAPNEEFKIEEYQSMYDKLQDELKKFNEWKKKNGIQY